jgi:hypothetical protein
MCRNSTIIILILCIVTTWADSLNASSAPIHDSTPSNSHGERTNNINDNDGEQSASTIISNINNNNNTNTNVNYITITPTNVSVNDSVGLGDTGEKKEQCEFFCNPLRDEIDKYNECVKECLSG